uniref:Uncharacterized protein n=1 Tax=Oncorhynchus mykiss TaxID=8022 RepID=A0A8C7SXQ3_ONCMY
MNSTTQPPAIIDGDVAVSSVCMVNSCNNVQKVSSYIGHYVTVYSFSIVCFRIDRLRHQLLPVYTYDPSEELHEVEQEMLWKEEDTKSSGGKCEKMALDDICLTLCKCSHR